MYPKQPSTFFLTPSCLDDKHVERLRAATRCVSPSIRRSRPRRNFSLGALVPPRRISAGVATACTYRRIDSVRSRQLIGRASRVRSALAKEAPFVPLSGRPAIYEKSPGGPFSHGRFNSAQPEMKRALEFRLRPKERASTSARRLSVCLGAGSRPARSLWL